MQSLKLTSVALQSLYFQYTHLPIGGKEIACPYWMNILKKGIVGPGGGKGRPEDIVKFTKDEAEKAGIDLNLLSETEIVNFLKDKRIGVDCSGFAFWMLDALDKEKGGNGLLKKIPEASGQFPASLANVKLLTSNKIAKPVLALDSIQVGDLIRLRHGKHVAVIIGVIREIGGIREIEYAHSSRMTEIAGVHRGLIRVINNKKSLEDQVWEEKDQNGDNYGQTEFFPEADDGIFRLLFFFN